MIVTPGSDAAAVPEQKTFGSKDDFLRLLITQMQNQDPTNTVDHTQFVAQLAQFSALEQQIQTNEQLADLQLTEQVGSTAALLSIIGHEVTASSHHVGVVDGVAGNISFELAGDASETVVEISDANGSFVRRIELGARSSGPQVVAWDGLDEQGQPVRDGQYQIEIEAHDAQEQPVSAVTTLRGVVDTISFDQGGAVLVIDGVSIRPADVLEIKRGAADAAPTNASDTPITGEGD